MFEIEHLDIDRHRPEIAPVIAEEDPMEPSCLVARARHYGARRDRIALATVRLEWLCDKWKESRKQNCCQEEQAFHGASQVDLYMGFDRDGIPLSALFYLPAFDG
jgi:hypothetical protein